MKSRILVWDLPVRIFHWFLVLCFSIAFLTAESEHWRDIHLLSGYTVLGLMLFRLAWGFVGSRHARFDSFVRGPKAIMRYAKSLLHGRPEHYDGHNPLGAVAILLLILLGIGSGVSGWLTELDVGGDGLEELHELLSNGMLGVVAIHIVGVLASSKMHHENLPLAMISGKKSGESTAAIPAPGRLAGFVLVAAILAFWAWYWNSLQLTGKPASGQATFLEKEGKAKTLHREDD